MENAEEVDARMSVPGLEELTGYAGRGVGIFWSPPLLVLSVNSEKGTRHTSRHYQYQKSRLARRGYRPADAPGSRERQVPKTPDFT